ncbi:hypothetical protein [Pantoea eucrina]|uniref:hypothetical protein n=1 Tax=Pantoea eucrina TaxID=472693 RepID=UPI00080F4A07|nr:hypothetical protein [Pantoea eucrina]
MKTAEVLLAIKHVANYGSPSGKMFAHPVCNLLQTNPAGDTCDFMRCAACPLAAIYYPKEDKLLAALEEIYEQA